MFADITDDFAIVINAETGVYYGMNPFTSSIFDNLIKGASIESINADVLSMDGAPSTFTSDLNRYIEELLSKELIVEGDQTNYQSSVNQALAKECNFEISWDEFKDAQELLLADPIHEVREDEGWSPEKSSLNNDSEDVARRKSKLQ